MSIGARSLAAAKALPVAMSLLALAYTGLAGALASDGEADMTARVRAAVEALPDGGFLVKFAENVCPYPPKINGRVVLEDNRFEGVRHPATRVVMTGVRSFSEVESSRRDARSQRGVK